MYPRYLNITQKDLNSRIKKAFQILESCTICPRKCKVNRLKNEKGFCRAGKEPIVSSFHPHFGEERCLVGSHGSGTIFLTHCNLACQFCQNYDISQLGSGEKVSLEKLTKMMISLQNIGCHNINFVSPTPYVPQILASLKIAIKEGLKLPLVYNTNCYDSIETLKLLDGIVDIYMPDAKYADKNVAKRYSKADNYPEIMKKALKEMHRQVGDLNFDKNGVAIKGLLIRHLVLPENLAGTKEVMDFLAKDISKNTAINIMDQYRPEYKAFQCTPLNRHITQEEYVRAVKAAQEAGLKNLV